MKIKKLLSLIAACAMAMTATVGAMSASAAETTYTGTNITCTLYDDGRFVVSGTGAESDWPTTDWLTDGNIANITSVEVQDGVTGVASGAFRGCTNLTSVTLAESVTTIKASAFRECRNENLVIEIKGNVSGLRRVMASCFTDTKATIKVYDTASYDVVKGFNLPECHVEYCGEMPAETGEIGPSATYNYNADTKTLTVSGTGVLFSREDMSNQIQFLDVETIVIEEGITEIGKATFKGFGNATSITIPSTVTSIDSASYGNEAFAGCNNPALVIDCNAGKDLAGSFGYSAFESGVTVNIHDIELWDAIQSGSKKYQIKFVGEVPTSGTFAESTLTWIYDTETQTLTISGTGDLSRTLADGSLRTNEAIKYCADQVKKLVFEDGVTSVGPKEDNQFWKKCTALEELVLGNSITEIPDNYFAGFEKLNTVKFSNGLTTIGFSAFGTCPALTAIELPDSVTTLKTSCFSYCTSLQTVQLGSGITELPQGCFNNCSALTGIELSDSITSIGENCFNNCTSLQTVKVGKGITALPAGCFSGLSNSNLQMEIMGEITNVDSTAFNDKVVGTITVHDPDTEAAIKAVATEANVVVVIDNFSDLKQAISEAKKLTADGAEALYTADTYKALTDALAEGEKVVKNEEADKTTVIDPATKAINDAITGLTFVGFTELDKLIAQADEILAHENDYWPSTILTLKNEALPNVKSYKEGIGNAEITLEIQTEINSKASTLKNAVDEARKIDKDELMSDLQNVIKTAEKLDPADYTEDSYAKLQEAVENAKKITLESDWSDFQVAQQGVEKAISDLSMIPLEPIVNIQKNGREAAIPTITADESMAGATKIKVIFNCASDVTFNSYSTIEIKAIVAGKENYQKFTGADGNAQGGVCEVVLPLSEAVKAGDKIDISGFTFAWSNASKHVYEITKIDFQNDDNDSLKKITAATIAEEKLKKAKEDLAEAIKKAEEIDTGKYTEATVAELAKAIEAAKEVTDEAPIEDINKALTALNNAIKALAEKQSPTKQDPTKQDPTKPSVTKPSVAPTTGSKATRSPEAVKKDKAAAKKAMKQAKITKLTAKSKAKKKINVTWKKVKKATGYQVQVSNKKNFKKVIFKKDLKKTKLTIKSKKIKSKKTYYVRVRAYATYKDKNNKTVKVYSKWNKKLRKVTVK